MTPRLYILAALAACVLTAMGSASISRWHALRGVHRDTAAAQERERAAEDRARAAEAREADAREAQAAAAEREHAASVRIAEIEDQRRALAAEVRATVPPKVRAARVVAAIPDATPGDVVPSTRAGREGFWVASERMVLMEEALRMRPILEAELAAVTEARAAALAQVRALEVRVVAVEDRARGWEIAYEAEAAARSQAVAEASPTLPGPVWAGIGAVGGALLGGVVGRATCPDAVTVVR